MKAKHLLLPTIALLFLAGCGEEEEFSRYPSVSIPEYKAEDYIADLSSSNPERVYNATVNLGEKAGGIAYKLCAEDADPASEEYASAKTAYDMACENMLSETPQIAAASLRFLQHFSRRYKPKTELFEMALLVESDHPLVRFEQITLLTETAQATAPVPPALLEKLHRNRSWIVSRSTYNLLGMLDDSVAREILQQDFQTLENIEDRLIIIESMGKRLQEQEARLLENVMLKTNQPKIRSAIAHVLDDKINVPGVRPWLMDQYPEFSATERALFFNEGKDLELSRHWLEKGFVPEDQFLTDLLKALFDGKEQKDEDRIRALDQMLLESPHVNEKWLNMKTEAEEAQKRLDEIRMELEPTAIDFFNQIKAIQKKYEIPNDEAEVLWEVMAEIVEPLIENEVQL